MIAFLATIAVYVFVGPWWGAGMLALVVLHDIMDWRLSEWVPRPNR